MSWKKGKIQLADGKKYDAEFLMRGQEVRDLKIYTENGLVEELNAQQLAQKLKRSGDEVYPFTFELEE